MMKLERLDTNVFPPNEEEARALELRNLRRAVRELRRLVTHMRREMLFSGDPSALLYLRANQLLAATTPRKLKGK